MSQQAALGATLSQSNLLRRSWPWHAEAQLVAIGQVIVALTAAVPLLAGHRQPRWLPAKR
jgi:hypothetical protein